MSQGGHRLPRLLTEARRRADTASLSPDPQKADHRRVIFDGAVQNCVGARSAGLESVWRRMMPGSSQRPVKTSSGKRGLFEAIAKLLASRVKLGAALGRDVRGRRQKQNNDTG